MMLATSTLFPHNIHTPPRPSPLSERSANVVPRSFTFSMASPAANDKKTSMPQRAYKPNPVVQTRDAATKRRRDMFFKRVQKDRDDRKWDARGEQIQRLDFLSEHKRWEAEKAREAPQLEDEMVEEEVQEEPTSSYTPSASQPEQVSQEADYIQAQEEYELQQLIASMEEEQDAVSQHYGSDDEDYDQIFMECTSTADSLFRNQQQHAQYIESNLDADAMDMS